MSEVLYGQTDTEKFAEEKLVCRDIAREISQFGINEWQRLFLLYTLATELENIEKMRAITSVISECSSGDIFISGVQEAL